MDNFFEFIEEDIEAKKHMLSTMPINNKTNKGKYNDALEKVLKKYQGYKEGVEKYILAPPPQKMIFFIKTLKIS